MFKVYSLYELSSSLNRTISSVRKDNALIKNVKFGNVP